MEPSERLEEDIMAAFRDAGGDVTVPPPGLVYWKAELRARRERVDLAARPMQVMSLISVVALGAACIGTSIVSGNALLIAAASALTVTLPAAAWLLRRALR